ncbi:hypothetical protein C8J57DRAFT_1336284 [Mycena rebaudengoi]|nr:hypothetical protein C8J57DRAFT_1336284 [Mycena rebaudengoi]
MRCVAGANICDKRRSPCMSSILKYFMPSSLSLQDFLLASTRFDLSSIYPPSNQSSSSLLNGSSSLSSATGILGSISCFVFCISSLLAVNKSY